MSTSRGYATGARTRCPAAGAPGGRITITVKAVPGRAGLASSRTPDGAWDDRRAGTGPRASSSSPTPPPPRLLFLTAGSGITPVRAMLHGLFGGAVARSRARVLPDVVLLHSAPTPGEVIFGEELRAPGGAVPESAAVRAAHEGRGTPQAGGPAGPVPGLGRPYGVGLRAGRNARRSRGAVGRAGRPAAHRALSPRRAETARRGRTGPIHQEWPGDRRGRRHAAAGRRGGGAGFSCRAAAGWGSATAAWRGSPQGGSVTCAPVGSMAMRATSSRPVCRPPPARSRSSFDAEEDHADHRASQPGRRRGVRP